ncbi:MAG: hypothetical protein LAQ69_22415 [Acidobacteriia bacterium]|nr:hypothetical protein [Terriglobia bacterium]
MERLDGKGLGVELIHCWERAVVERMAPPESGALSFRGMARMVFDQMAAARRVILVSTDRGILLILIDAGGQWRDVKGERCTVTVGREERRRDDASVSG